LIGVEEYVKVAKVTLQKRLRLGKLAMNTILAGLTGIPVWGWATAITQVHADAQYERWTEKKVRKCDELERHFNDCYRNTVGQAAIRKGYFEFVDEFDRTIRQELKKDVLDQWKKFVIDCYRGRS
jgi:hypothetical protein